MKINTSTILVAGLRDPSNSIGYEYKISFIITNQLYFDVRFKVAEKAVIRISNRELGVFELAQLQSFRFSNSKLTVMPSRQKYEENLPTLAKLPICSSRLQDVLKTAGLIVECNARNKV